MNEDNDPKCKNCGKPNWNCGCECKRSVDGLHMIKSYPRFPATETDPEELAHDECVVCGEIFDTPDEATVMGY